MAGGCSVRSPPSTWLARQGLPPRSSTFLTCHRPLFAAAGLALAASAFAASGTLTFDELDGIGYSAVGGSFAASLGPRFSDAAVTLSIHDGLGQICCSNAATNAAVMVVDAGQTAVGGTAAQAGTDPARQTAHGAGAGCHRCKVVLSHKAL